MTQGAFDGRHLRPSFPARCRRTIEDSGPAGKNPSFAVASVAAPGFAPFASRRSRSGSPPSFSVGPLPPPQTMSSPSKFRRNLSASRQFSLPKGFRQAPFMRPEGACEARGREIWPMIQTGPVHGLDAHCELGPLECTLTKNASASSLESILTDLLDLKRDCMPDARLG